MFDIKTNDLIVSESGNTLTIKTVNPKTGKNTKLSEALNFLPSGIIYKAETGMGATTLELTSLRNSIIVEPTRSTAFQKANNPNNPFPALYVGSDIETRKGIEPSMIKSYLRSKNPFKKFLVVAESLTKLIKQIPTKELGTYHFTIDESDSFQLDSTFRDGMEKCLDIYKQIEPERRSMVTATPLEFTDPELLNEPKITIRYEHGNKRDVQLFECDNGFGVLVESILKKFSGDPSNFEKVVIALNSLSLINSVIEAITDDKLSGGVDIAQINVLCSSSSEAKVIKYHELKGEHLPGLVTFITSAFFTGLDLQDKFHLFTYVSSKESVLRLSEKKIKQVAGRGRNGLLSETIIYERKDIPKGPFFSFHDLKEAAESQLQSLNCIEKTYSKSPIMKARIESTFKAMLTNGAVDSSRLVRKNLKGDYSVSFLNIDALLEYSRVAKTVYHPKNGLAEALRTSGCVVNISQKHSALTPSETDTHIAKLASTEKKKLITLLYNIAKRKMSFEEAYEEQATTKAVVLGLSIFEKFRKYIDEDVLIEAISKTLSKERSGTSVRNLKRLETKLDFAIQDPTTGFLKELFQKIPLSPEKGVWYSNDDLIHKYQQAAAISGKLIPPGTKEDVEKMILEDIKAIFETRSSNNNERDGYYLKGRKIVEGLPAGLKKYFFPGFAAEDYIPD
ncbi:DEAD/DEAH box helicase family protein [Algoriphagus hitonicola]|uniref:Uncharacterized protein n=2 Tax=Algoriphagus hitonicola TaxID=435880 RepID=A0A1I2VB41_9BACT|nr:hypothetical protein SAMN04487988_10920 [Algoriphagus hitonicola]